MAIMGDRMDLHERILSAVEEIEKPAGRPLVTLSYAQSLDGSIAARKGVRTQISGAESAQLTHHLRAYHDAILIGIGTLLADDPRLTVRLVKGNNPRPIILDSQLRTPLESFLVRENPPWIVTAENAAKKKAGTLSALGARVIDLPTSDAGQIQLQALMKILHQEGIRRLMVEGGAAVLSSFYKARLVDFVALTISPMILGGLPAVQLGGLPDFSMENQGMLRLERINTGFAGEDLMVFGHPRKMV